MNVETKRWDAAKALLDTETERLFLSAVAEGGDPAELADAIDAVARARGMRELGRELGVSAKGLFDLLNPYGSAVDQSALRQAADKLMSGASGRSDAA